MKEICKQAYNDYLSLCALVNGVDFEKSKKELSEPPMNETEKRYDVNFGTCCFTVDNVNGKAFVNEYSIELWEDDDLLDSFSIKEIEEKLDD
jgi:hypothetical protein